MNTLGRNRTFPIYKSDGTSFHDLVLIQSTADSVVMSLGDKITGDVYYKDNTLAVTMSEYVEYNGVHYVLVNPPTVVREGMVSDNSELKGMTKYSFTFYHPMYMLGNFPFTDVAVSSDQNKYLSQDKTFSWMGTGFDLIDKLNKNLAGTQWVVVASSNTESLAKLALFPSQIQANGNKKTEKDDVLTFDRQYISDVLKTFYDNWNVPFIIDKLDEGQYYDSNHVDYYSQAGGSKRFVIVFGLPTNRILDENNNEYVFSFGRGVGLKNNSRTQRNNKIITRIAGYGSENNIPYGYPQIQWYGNQSWDYTIDNDPNNPNSYQIYRGIVNGQYVKLIKHPFTRSALMPTVYVNSVFNKVSPYLSSGNANPNYNPDTTIVDYYDAIDDGTHIYPNNIVQDSPSFEIHQFENIKPELGTAQIVSVLPYDENEENSITTQQFTAFMNTQIASYDGITARYLTEMLAAFNVTPHADAQRGYTGGSYTYEWRLKFDGNYCKAFYNSPVVMFEKNVKVGNAPIVWDDSIDDDGNYKQSYFKITLPQLDFDLYACAAITEEMEINMRSGDCMGCTFVVQVDWDDYKKNFYDSNGNFAPNGSQRDLTKYPKSNLGEITVVVAKDIDTFGTIMPDIYRQPLSGDEFVILGISLPLSYVTSAQTRLDEAMKEYMLENNVYYYDYPLKFDEHFLATHTDILAQIRNNSVIAFAYGNEPTKKLYVKQITVKYGYSQLPTYDITLTDDVEIVLNQIGQVTDDVSRVRLQMSELQKYYGANIANLIDEKLSRVEDDVAKGRITFQQGLDAIGSAIFSDEIKSNGFVQGMTEQGRGWRIDAQGNAEFESLRCRSYLEVIELLINRLQAQEGDTLFTDNDQITFVEEKTYNETTYYKLTLKEKWDGYTTCQKVGNIIKGIINTLAANAGNVSDVTPQQSVESDGNNKYYTSWMRVVDPSNFGDTNGTNQICVVLYSDSDTPANKNFPPCELMNIARWGCALNPNEQGISASEKADRKRRQNLFMISTSDGRLVKLNGVNTPKLSNGNYGTTLGELPDFVKAYPAVAQRLVDGGDYLYAQGIVVGDFIKIDVNGVPVVNYVDQGEWQDNTTYLCNEYNSTTKQYETHDVWHNNALWRCLQHEPVTVGGVTTYYEPTEQNSAYWQKLMESANGDSIRSLTVYKVSDEAPAKPVQTTVPINATVVANDWMVYPPKLGVNNDNVPQSQGMTPWADMKPSDPNYSTFGSGWKIAKGNNIEPEADGFMVVDRIYFVPTSDHYPISIEIAASAEMDCDGVLVGTVNKDAGWWDSNWDDQDYSTNGDEPLYIKPVVVYADELKGQQCFVDVVFRKDESVSENDDCGYYRVTSGVKNQIWCSAATLKNNVVQGAWSDVTPWNGVDGKDGNDGESPKTYEIQSNVDSIRLANSQAQVTLSGTARFYSKIGTQEREEEIFKFAVYTKSIVNNADTYTLIQNGTWKSVTFNGTTITASIKSVVVYIFSQAYTGTSPESQAYLAKKEIFVYNNGDNGTNAFVVDLDPQMSSVALDANGNTSSAVDFYFYPRAYYGSTPVISDCTLSRDTPPTNITVTPDNTSDKRFRVQINSGVAINEANDIICTVTHATYGSRTVTFRLAGVKGGANAVLQELTPNLSAISFARTDADELKPSYRELSFIIKKTEGSATSTQTISQSGLTVRWSVSSMPATSSGGNAWGSGTVTGITWNSGSMRVANSIAYINIYVAAFNSSGTLVDMETIPIVKDGKLGTSVKYAYAYNEYPTNPSEGDVVLLNYPAEANDMIDVYEDGEWQGYSVPYGTIYICIKDEHSYEATANGWVDRGKFTGDDGENAATALASPDKLVVPCDSIGGSYGLPSNSISFTLKVGSDSNVATITSITYGTLPTGVSVSGSGTSTRSISVNTSASASGMAAGVTFTVTGTFGGKTYTATVTVALIGASKGDTGVGQRGKTGRFYYYATEWDASNTTLQYTANDAQSPYFKVGSSYYVYVGENNFTDKTMYDINRDYGAPSSSNANFAIMANDFDYLITKAIFGDYAHFGSNIVNGDYRFSQYGYMRGFEELKASITDDTQYENCDPNDMFGEDPFFDASKMIVNTTFDSYAEITETDADNSRQMIVGNMIEYAPHHSVGQSSPSIINIWSGGNFYFRYRNSETESSYNTGTYNYGWNEMGSSSMYSFAVHSSATSAPNSGWDTYPPGQTASKPYLWLRIRNGGNFTYKRVSSKIAPFNISYGKWYAVEFEMAYDGVFEAYSPPVLYVGTQSTRFSVASTYYKEVPFTYNNINMVRVCYLFKCEVSGGLTGCNLWVTQPNKIYAAFLREAQFVPYLCEDLLQGKIVLNKVVARGELHAESMYYSVLGGIQNNDIIVREQSIVTLGYNSVNCRVVLPIPSEAKNRVIEIYSGLFDTATRSSTTQQYWRLGYSGATYSSYFESPCGTGSYREANFQQWNETYVKLWSDGEKWYVIKAEKTIRDTETNKFYIQLTTKDYPNN